MFSRKTMIVCAAAAALTAPGFFSASAHAAANWDAFVIRNGTGDIAPSITKNGDDGVTASIVVSGQKAGFGTNFFDGMSLSQVGKITYDRVDDGTTTTSPYINIWVTDGTHYAVLAPHSITKGGSSPGFGSIPEDQGNDVNGLNLQTLGFSVYENSASSDFSWMLSDAIRPNAGTGVLVHSGDDQPYVTLSEIGNLTVLDPNSLSPAPWTGGSGAPKNGTGFNIIFGEIQGTSVTPIPYQLANIQVTAVPEPTSLAIFVGLGGLALLSRRTRRKVA